MWWTKQAPSSRVVDVDFSKSLRISTSSDVWVICLQGTAWLTRDGCLADVILSPGDVMRVSRADDALVTGMPLCRLGLAPTREQVAELQGRGCAAVPTSRISVASPAAVVQPARSTAGGVGTTARPRRLRESL